MNWLRDRIQIDKVPTGKIRGGQIKMTKKLILLSLSDSCSTSFLPSVFCLSAIWLKVAFNIRMLNVKTVLFDHGLFLGEVQSLGMTRSRSVESQTSTVLKTGIIVNQVIFKTIKSNTFWLIKLRCLKQEQFDIWIEWARLCIRHNFLICPIFTETSPKCLLHNIRRPACPKVKFWVLWFFSLLDCGYQNFGGQELDSWPLAHGAQNFLWKFRATNRMRVVITSLQKIKWPFPEFPVEDFYRATLFDLGTLIEKVSSYRHQTAVVCDFPAVWLEKIMLAGISAKLSADICLTSWMRAPRHLVALQWNSTNSTVFLQKYQIHISSSFYW